GGVRDMPRHLRADRAAACEARFVARLLGVTPDHQAVLAPERQLPARPPPPSSLRNASLTSAPAAVKSSFVRPTKPALRTRSTGPAISTCGDVFVKRTTLSTCVPASAGHTSSSCAALSNDASGTRCG